MKKRWIGYGMALVMISALSMPALAYDTVRQDDATLRPDYKIVIDGQSMNFKRSDGSPAFALVYEDATYLPLRAIGETLGRNVNWDEKTKTITLAGERTSSTSSGSAATGKKQEVTVQVRPDFNIVIDGTARQFTTSSGKSIYPLLYDGSTYLPLRAIGQIMNKTVAWNQNNKTITLTSGSSSTVTDADSFTDASQQPSAGDIGAEKAKQIALSHAGLKASQVQGLRADVDWDNGRKEYDVEFWQGATEYDYEIDAATGEIRQAKKEYDDSHAGSNTAATNDIGIEKAKQIALNHAGLAESQVYALKTDTDWDNGRKEYEVDFKANGMEYDYEIDAANGTILKADKEYDD